jgi:acyl-CoA synthetase (AMP-forming)/AMP-acid ligase II
MGGIAYNGQALDGVSIRISTDDEIQIRGAMLFREYRDGTNPKTHDGWFATGDLGELDSHRKLRVLGRRDDLINTGGFKVWPKTVEDSINEMAGVTECVVRGLPDENWGTAVCAWIVLENQKRSFNIDAVRLHVKKSLPDYCAPQKLFIVDQIPRSALGKVQISELLKLNTLAL